MECFVIKPKIMQYQVSTRFSSVNSWTLKSCICKKSRGAIFNNSNEHDTSKLVDHSEAYHTDFVKIH